MARGVGPRCCASNRPAGRVRAAGDDARPARWLEADVRRSDRRNCPGDRGPAGVLAAAPPTDARAPAQPQRSVGARPRSGAGALLEGRAARRHRRGARLAGSSFYQLSLQRRVAGGTPPAARAGARGGWPALRCCSAGAGGGPGSPPVAVAGRGPGGPADRARHGGGRGGDDALRAAGPSLLALSPSSARRACRGLLFGDVPRACRTPTSRSPERWPPSCWWAGWRCFTRALLAVGFDRLNAPGLGPCARSSFDVRAARARRPRAARRGPRAGQTCWSWPVPRRGPASAARLGRGAGWAR